MIDNFFLGIKDSIKGFHYLLSHRNLFKFVLPPLIVNLSLSVMLVFIFIHYYSPLYEAFADKLGGLEVETTAWWTYLVTGLLWLVRGILHMVLGLLLIIALVFAVFMVSQFINSPFYDLLSEAVEKQVTGKDESPPFNFGQLLDDLGRTLVTELKKLALLINIPIFLLLFNIIPLIGALLYTICTNLFAMWDLGFNYVAYPMGRKIVAFRDQIRFGRSHKVRLIGFGLPLLIPFVNLIMAPAFVVGGTLLYLELQE